MKQTVMRNLALGICAVAFSCAAGAADTMQGMAMSGAMAGPSLSAADKAKIMSAMSAAPKAVAMNATVMDMGADGKMRLLRKGSNGFTCVPDDPQTPGPDPMCADKNAMLFLDAMAKHQPPPQGKVGFMYMLAGGTDASNTDPFATKPTTTNHWIKTGPHVMVLGADAAFYAGYPHGPDPDTSAPYVMWAGTPYQHLMVPVK